MDFKEWLREKCCCWYLLSDEEEYAYFNQWLDEKNERKEEIE